MASVFHKVLERLRRRYRGSAATQSATDVEQPSVPQEGPRTSTLASASTQSPLHIQSPAKARALELIRKSASTADAPSYSSSPPPEVSEPSKAEVSPENGVKLSGETNKNAEERSTQLAILLAAAENEVESHDIEQRWSTPEGQAALLAEQACPESSETPAMSRSRQREGGVKLRGSRHSEVDDLCGSDEERRVIAMSIACNVKETSGVTTRRGTTLGTVKAKQRDAIDEDLSVPIPRGRGRTLRDRLASRAPVPSHTQEGSLRRSRRLRKLEEDFVESSGSEEDEDFAEEISDDRESNSESSDQEAADSFSALASGSGDEFYSSSNGARTDNSGESIANSSDDDEVYEEIHKTQRAKAKKTLQRQGTRKRGSKRARSAGSSSYKKSISKNGSSRRRLKRRRTTPNSIFESPQHSLSAEEKRERLEALVKQTADITRDLNAAMAAEKERDVARVQAQSTEPATIGARLVRRQGMKAGTPQNKDDDVLWPTAQSRELQPHQIDGVRWLLTLDSQGLNAILADEMGLGKTIQTITFLATLLACDNRGPHLVVAPKNVVPHWVSEIEAWYPGKFKVFSHFQSGAERFEKLGEAFRKSPDFDIFVTSFDLALRDFLTKPRPENALAWEYRHSIRFLQKIEFEFAVIDEAHRLKNADARFSASLRNYSQASRRLLLTGTPLSNNLRELWGLMNVLNPRIFGSKDTFEAWFAAPFDTDGKGFLTLAEQSVIVDRLHTVLRPFFRRRLREDVCPSYSSSDEVVVKCPLSGLQKALTVHFRKNSSMGLSSVNNAVMELRKVANHPYVVSGSLFDLPVLRTSHGLVSICGKFFFLYYAIPKLLAAKHTILIFSQFRRVLDFVEDLLDLLGLKYGRLDGMTASEERNGIVERFNAPGSDIPIFLLTTRAGGVGLNLQSADTVILFDSDWNPSADLQAVSRIQRIGQKRTVHILRLVSENSIDQVIVDRARNKLRTEAVAVGAGKFNTQIDPEADKVSRQLELEQLLQEFETQQSQSKTVQPDLGLKIHSQRGSSDDSTLPGLSSNQDSTMSSYLKVWDEQLLRKGETSLPESSLPLESFAPDINDAETVPKWLHSGGDFAEVSSALKCDRPMDVPRALEKCRHEKALKSGTLPAKRQTKARFSSLVDAMPKLDGDSESSQDSSSFCEPDMDYVANVEEDSSSESESDVGLFSVEGNQASQHISAPMSTSNLPTIDQGVNTASSLQMPASRGVSAPFVSQCGNASIAPRTEINQAMLGLKPILPRPSTVGYSGHNLHIATERPRIPVLTSSISQENVETTKPLQSPEKNSQLGCHKPNLVGLSANECREAVHPHHPLSAKISDVRTHTKPWVNQDTAMAAVPSVSPPPQQSLCLASSTNMIASEKSLMKRNKREQGTQHIAYPSGKTKSQDFDQPSEKAMREQATQHAPQHTPPVVLNMKGSVVRKLPPKSGIDKRQASRSIGTSRVDFGNFLAGKPYATKNLVKPNAKNGVSNTIQFKNVEVPQDVPRKFVHAPQSDSQIEVIDVDNDDLNELFNTAKKLQTSKEDGGSKDRTEESPHRFPLSSHQGDTSETMANADKPSAKVKVDPNLIDALSEFTGVHDRNLLADVLVQCDHSLECAADYLLSCE